MELFYNLKKVFKVYLDYTANIKLLLRCKKFKMQTMK